VTTIDQLEQALHHLDEVMGMVARAEAWLETHNKAHPQYQEAQRRYKARLAEAEQAEKAVKELEQQNKREAAEWRGYAYDENSAGRPPSLNCMVCGLPVHGWPRPTPGHYVHLDCWEGRNAY